MRDRLEFGILGPLEVSVAGEAIRVGGPKQRALLALLLLSANRVVSRDRLIGELFGDETATPADTALRVRVSRLRTALRVDQEEPRLVARPPGYLLRVEPDELDLARFERRVARAREHLAANDAHTAADLLRDALSLWRGRPLADLEFEPFVRLEIERLEELRLSAVEDWIDAELAVGRHAHLVPELEALTSEHPLRERLRSQLMLALYRSGRQAEGLEIYRRTRTLLHEELGLEPGTALRELQRAMLAQEPSLDLPRANGHGVERPLSGDICPFKGLAAYDREDDALFFGREQVVAELVAMSSDTQLIAVIGASGSGKSSLLRAGLLPALAGREVLVRPGAAPLAALEHALGSTWSTALASLRPGARIVLAIDQFEETFSVCDDESERDAFVARLVDAAWDPDRRVLIVVALRADFFPRLAAYPELARLVGAGHVLLGPMNERDLASAIEGPSAHAGLTVDPALVAALVRDVAGEPGGLPLLSTTLVELWRNRSDGVLTFSAYQQSGGVRGAVARLAEGAYAQLAPDARVLARRILLRMVAGGGNEPAVRRSLAVDALEPAHASVVDQLTEARLLTRSDGVVEIAHEALLTHWPRLRSWLDESAEGRALHRHLSAAARAWSEGGREASELYRGARLAATVEWAEQNGTDLDLLERQFIDESRRVWTHEMERERRANRRLRRQRALALVLVGVAAAAVAWALVKRHDAQAAAISADAERLGAQALVEPNLDRALLLARAGVALDDSLATRSHLLATLLRSPAAIAVMHGHGAGLRDEALSPDGHTLAVRGDDGATRLFDTRTFRQLATAIPGSNQIALAAGGLAVPLHALAFTPDGRTLAIGGADGTSATLALVDTRTHRQRLLERSVNAATADIAVSPDGRTLATGEEDFSRRNEIVVLRDVGSGLEKRETAPIRGARLVGFVEAGRALLVMRDDARSLVLDAQTLRPVRTLPPASAAAISPNGAEAALAHGDGSVSIVDVRSGTSRTLRGRVDGGIGTIAFAKGGRILATGAADGTVSVWTRKRGLGETLAGHAAGVQAVAFSPDARTLYSASRDGTAIAWDVSGERRLARLVPFGSGPGGPSSASAVNPAGSLLAFAPAHDRIELMGAANHRASRLGGPAGDTNELRFSRDGKLLADGGTTNRSVNGAPAVVTVWDVARRQMTHRFPDVGAVAFSPDGGTLAAGSGTGGVTLYDLRTGDEKLTLATPHGIDSVDYSRDGKLVAASLDGTATVWDPAHSSPSVRLTGQTADYVARFSPSGKEVAVGDSTGAVVLWDVATGRRVGLPLTGHNGGVLGIAFSPNGKMLVTSSGDAKLRLWDLAHHKLVGEPLPGSDTGGPVDFFPDGKHVLGMWSAGTAVVWDVDSGDWAARACSVANRNLTRSEWSRFLPGVAYRRICP